MPRHGRVRDIIAPGRVGQRDRTAGLLSQRILMKTNVVGRESLRRALTEYMTHFHEEPVHQGLENRRFVKCWRSLRTLRMSIVGLGSAVGSATSTASLHDAFV